MLGEDGTVLDVSAHVADYTAEFFAGDGLERLRAAVARGEDLPEVDLVTERVGACVARPSKVICVGLNYRDHAAESGLAAPEEPVIFFKAPNIVVDPYDDVAFPAAARRPTGRWSSPS